MEDSNQRYNPESSILFVCTCSFQKQSDRDMPFSPDDAITNGLPGNLSSKLHWRRHEIMRKLRAGEIVWQGQSLRDHEYNELLTRGPEFGGQDEALYLPAIDRYAGRFFQQLLKNGRDAVLSTSHHILFLSGLYGLVRPLESIQLYSCKVNADVAKQWREGELLTKTMEAYCTHHRIRRIFDLTAMADYRGMVDWDRLAAELSSRGDSSPVLRCCWRNADGAEALAEFGALMRDRLLPATESELLSIAPERDNKGVLRDHRIVFLRPGETRPDLPKEEAAGAGDGPADQTGDAVPPDPRSKDGIKRELVLTDGFFEGLDAQSIADSKSDGLNKQILKCLRQLGRNPRHPGLNTHEFRMKNPYRAGQPVYEAYVQNNTPGAHRIIWCYDPSDSARIMVLSVIAHPKKAAHAG